MAIASTALTLPGAERQVVFPAGTKVVGPYSPGIFVGEYLYVSGQGASDPQGRRPPTFEGQARQCLENVKTVLEAAGLTMAHIVYSQVYLEDLGNLAIMDRVWSQYFPSAPPARATVGVARMPTDTPVEINAVAVRNLSNKRAISGAVLTHDRLYLPGAYGIDPKTGKPPQDPAREVELALEAMRRNLTAAGLDLRHVVFVNPYVTDTLPLQVMNEVYARNFEFGNTPARATIRVAGLPGAARVAFTGVAVRDLKQRRAVRPKNMRPSATASPCVFAGDTLYCSAKAGFIPGPQGGIFAEDVGHQARQVMRNLLDGLEEAGLDFSHVVKSNVYVDDIEEFQQMNRVYGLYFEKAPPTRTTVQPHAPVERRRDSQGRMPKLVEISVIAVQ